MGTRPAPATRLSRWLERLPRRLRAHGVEAAYLFGSHARQEADSDSDVDLILVAPSDRPFVERFRDFHDVWFGAPTAVDLLVYTPQEFAEQRRHNRFIRHVLRHAQRLV